MNPTVIACVVNGRAEELTVSPRQTLADVLRDVLDLTGTHVGCGHGACGACSVLLDGVVVRSCLVLAPAVAGSTVETVEGLAERSAIATLQQAFMQHGALQCGFCTSGMLMAAHDLLRENPHPSRAEIRDALGGHYCRCTGYGPIVDAIEAAAAAVAGEGAGT